jgi:hypothetical protein
MISWCLETIYYKNICSYFINHCHCPYKGPRWTSHYVNQVATASFGVAFPPHIRHIYHVPIMVRLEKNLHLLFARVSWNYRVRFLDFE